LPFEFHLALLRVATRSLLSVGPPLAFFLTPLMMLTLCPLPPLCCCATRPSDGCSLLQFRLDLPTRNCRRCVRLLRRLPCRSWIAPCSRSPYAR
jgi:hypothetical protein